MHNPSGIDSEETEVPLTDVTLADGVATLENFEFPYAGVYTITCTLPESNKYDDEARAISRDVCVEVLEGEEYQTIEITKPEKAIGTYGDNAEDTKEIEFKATVADVDFSDLDKGWKVASSDIDVSNCEITINENTIEEKEDGLFSVSGEIKKLKPTKAGNNLTLTLTYSHIDNENQKVYGDATNSTTFSINQKPLHVTGITFEDKIYDGTPNVGIQSVTFNENDIIKEDKGNVVADINGQTFQLATAARDDKDNVEEGMSYLSWEDEIQWDEGQTGTISLVNEAMNDNYLIVKGEGTDEKVFTCEIKRRPIYLQVSDGTREYGTDLPEDQTNVELKADDRDA